MVSFVIISSICVISKWIPEIFYLPGFVFDCHFHPQVKWNLLLFCVPHLFVRRAQGSHCIKLPTSIFQIVEEIKEDPRFWSSIVIRAIFHIVTEANTLKLSIHSCNSVYHLNPITLIEQTCIMAGGGLIY